MKQTPKDDQRLWVEGPCARAGCGHSRRAHADYAFRCDEHAECGCEGFDFAGLERPKPRYYGSGNVSEGVWWQALQGVYTSGDG